MSSSQISEVVVHARGAWVTRQWSGTESAPGEIEISLRGITPLAEPGSVRASVGGSRRVLSVHTALEVPSESTPLGPTVERLLELQNQKRRLEAEWALLQETRARLSTAVVDPGVAARARAERVGDRFGAALRVSELLSELNRSSGERLTALMEQVSELDREIVKQELEDAQTSDQTRMGTGHPKRTIKIHLGGEGPIEGLSVRYAVRAARWWPMYTLRIPSGGKDAEWWLESLVAQRTGEDWSGVKIGLSTSDLVRDGQLPELRSLRIGRAQPALRSGFREPPSGLDALFEPHDRVFGEAIAKPEPPRPSRPRSSKKRRKEAEGLDLEDTLGGALDEMAAPPMPPAAAAPMRDESRAMFEEVAAATGMMPMAKSMRSRGAPAAPMRNMVPADFGGGGEGLAYEPEEPPEPVGLDLAGDWLDFDRLRLAPASDHAHRGRLHVRAAGPEVAWMAKAQRRVENLSPRDMVRDPLRERGSFDHRYDGDAPVDIPSDGLAHRLRLASRAAKPHFSYRVVPKEVAEVYREVELDNPFDAPLLGGPVEVYLDGTLLLVAPLQPTERGAKIRVGLGVEERIRVARNVVVREDTTGLLRGSTAVEHQVSVELRSALGFAVDVEVLERSPVTDVQDLEVVMLPSQPKAEPYTQADRSSPIRGGWRFLMHLGEAESRTLKWGYKLVFPAKQEIVGGNRRD